MWVLEWNYKFKTKSKNNSTRASRKILPRNEFNIHQKATGFCQDYHQGSKCKYFRQHKIIHRFPKCGFTDSFWKKKAQYESWKERILIKKMVWFGVLTFGGKSVNYQTFAWNSFPPTQRSDKGLQKTLQKKEIQLWIAYLRTTSITERYRTETILGPSETRIWKAKTWKHQNAKLVYLF